MCRWQYDLHRLRSIYIYKTGEEVQQNICFLSEVKFVDCNLIYINSDLYTYVHKKGEVVQQNTCSHSEVKCVDFNLIYINSEDISVQCM